MKSMLIRDLLSGVEIIRAKQDLNLSATAMTRSSLNVAPGSLYFAMKGARIDGHQFIPQVIDKRAVAAVVEDATAHSEGTILVANVREAWGIASANWFGNPSSQIELVGVTGTNGKTTTTYLLRSIWSHLKIQSGLVGTVACYVGEERLASELTTPDAYDLQAMLRKMVDERVSHAAMEVSSIALDQFRVAGCRFKVAQFTNLTQDHLDYHGTMHQYFEAKARLFRDYGISIGVLNLDDAASDALKACAPGVAWRTYSTGKTDGDFVLRTARFDKRGTLATIATPEGNKTMRLLLLGRHNISNALGALATATSLGHSIDHCLQALQTAPGAPGRMERPIHGDDLPQIFVDYAHSEDALRNVLKFLNELKREFGGRIITVFGCGGDRDRTKRPKMAQAASELSDFSVLTSDNPRTEDPERILDEVESGVKPGAKYVREVDRRKAISLALESARGEDIVLIAGKGHEDYQIIGQQKFPFDDRDVVRDYYK